MTARKAVLTEKGAVQGRKVGAVANAVRILRVLADSSAPLGVNEIARRAETTASTTHDILKTLAADGIVRQQDASKAYKIHVGILSLLGPMMRVKRAISESSEALKRLTEELGVISALWVRTAPDRVTKMSGHNIQGRINIAMADGQRLPIQAGALGRFIATGDNLTPAGIEAFLDQVRWGRRPDAARYLAQVAEAQKLGFAEDSGDLFQGFTSIAAWASDAEGAPRYAVTATSLTASMTDDRRQQIGSRVRDIAQALSESTQAGDAGDE